MLGSTQRRAQVECVAVLSNDRVVSGSDASTLKVWDVSSGACIRTLGHSWHAPRRRPVKQRVDRSSTPRGAQVQCVVAVLSNGRVVSGSADRTLKVWEDVEGKMARLIALRRTPENYDWRLIGRLIAKFL